MTDHSPSTSYITSTYDFEAPEAQNRWNRLYLDSKQRSPFSTLVFATSMAAHADLKVSAWFVSDGKKDLAGILLFTRSQGPFSRIVVPGFTPYTSFLFAEAKPNQEAWMLLLDKLASSYDDLRFHLHPNIEDIRPAHWVNWRSTVYYTYRIDLESYNTDMASWSDGQRRNFRKHQDRYLFEENSDLLGKCIELCAAGYERKGRPFPLNPQSLLNITQDLASNQMIRVFAASSGKDAPGSQRPEAGLVILHDETTAYYWIAGSEPGPAMTVLIGKVLPALKEAGFKTFDFVGANTPNIAEFKRRFGATLTPYHAVMKTPNRLLASILYTKRLLT